MTLAQKNSTIITNDLPLMYSSIPQSSKTRLSTKVKAILGR